jgi:serine/threonine-protein kinase RsbT
MGLGLSGSKRLVDEFAIDTVPGRGTIVRMVKWTRF